MAKYVTLWAALTDATPENSCLHFVPRGIDPGLSFCPFTVFVTCVKVRSWRSCFNFEVCIYLIYAINFAKVVILQAIQLEIPRMGILCWGSSRTRLPASDLCGCHVLQDATVHSWRESSNVVRLHRLWRLPTRRFVVCLCKLEALIEERWPSKYQSFFKTTVQAASCNGNYWNGFHHSQTITFRLAIITMYFLSIKEKLVLYTRLYLPYTSHDPLGQCWAELIKCGSSCGLVVRKLGRTGQVKLREVFFPVQNCHRI